MSDTRTTTRWSVGELAWLEGQAAVRACGRVGSVVRAIVQEAMARDLAVGPAAPDGETAGGVAGAFTEEELVGGASAALGRVPRGAAPVPPSGAAPARRSRLDVVVARLLSPGPGQIPPSALAQARRRIRDGGVDVSGRGSGELAPELLVGPGEVVLR